MVGEARGKEKLELQARPEPNGSVESQSHIPRSYLTEWIDPDGRMHKCVTICDKISEWRLVHPARYGYLKWTLGRFNAYAVCDIDDPSAKVRLQTEPPGLINQTKY